MADTGRWSEYYVTAAGRALRQRCFAEGIRPIFAGAAIGSGKPVDPAEIDTMDSLVSYSKDVILKKSYAIEENHLCIVRVDNSGYNQDVFMTEVATFAYGEDQTKDQKILYGYAYNIEGYVLIPRQTSITNRKIYEITLDTHLSRATEIQIVFDETSLWVSHADLDDLIASWFATAYVATIAHEFDYDPMVALYENAEGFARLPFGAGAFGGGPAASVAVKVEHLGGRRINIYTIPKYAGSPRVVRHSKRQVALVYPDDRNLIIMMG